PTSAVCAEGRPHSGRPAACHPWRSSARQWSSVAHSVTRRPAPVHGALGTTLATDRIAMSPNPRTPSAITGARRYPDHGFLDVAFRIFARHVEHVRPDDWARLVERLIECGRVTEAVETCRTGGVPMPRRELLVRGDRCLRTKDVDAAIHYYEL